MRTDQIPADTNSIWHYVFVVMAGVLVYSNTLHSPFVFDGYHAIVLDPLIKDLGFFLDPSAGRWSTAYVFLITRYFGLLTFALNYRMHGLEVGEYHLVNISIHVINARLVYALTMLSFETLLLRLSPLKSRSRSIAFFTALLFVSHPVQTQAIT